VHPSWQESFPRETRKANHLRSRYLRQVKIMVSGVRALLFQTELELPPIEELKIGKEQVRKLYTKMHEPGGYCYENLDMQSTSPTLSTRRTNGYSECQVGPDTIRITEDRPEFDIDEFVCVVKNCAAQPRKRVSAIYRPKMPNGVLVSAEQHRSLD